MVELDETNGWVYYFAQGDPERPYDTHLYRCRLDGSATSRLTDVPGQHDLPQYLSVVTEFAHAGIAFSPSKRFFLDTHSDIDRPPAVDLRRADGSFVMTLSRADTRQLQALGWTPPERFVAKADDGKTDLHGLIYKPADFDPSKKYPVLDYIYNGPQTTWVEHTFLGPTGTMPRAMSQLGFVVLTVDGRGTPGRGKAFQDVVYGRFGQHEVPDHVATLKSLAASRPYLDLSRVGVFGGSFGGYMTIRAMLTAPGIYRVGVAQSPIADLEDLGAEIEIYMGLPGDRPEAYAAASCRKLASELRGNLLIIHGTADVNAPFASTMRFVSALTESGRHCDLEVQPDQPHVPSGQSALRAVELTRRYFQEHLKP